MKNYSYHQKVNALLVKFNKLLLDDFINIQSIIDKYDCAIITILKKDFNNCLYGEDDPKYLNIIEHLERYKLLRSKLLYNYYVILSFKNPFTNDNKSPQDIGNTDIELPVVKVREDTFFVINIDNSANFVEEIINLGKLFCQDSVTIFEKGGDVKYVYGTSNGNFPGLDNKEYFSHLYFGSEAEIKTKIGGEQFHLPAPDKKFLYFEHFTNLQNNSKFIVSRLAKKINELLE